MRFAAFGRTQWLYDSIVRLCDSGHEVALIGTSAASAEYTVTEKDFERLALELGCAYFCDSSINRKEYVTKVQSLCLDVAISVNWLSLIGSEMICSFEHGIINAHTGDLPRFRGNACPNWAILNGESKIVLSLHNMSLELDAGPILLKKSYLVSETTYIGDVYKFLNEEIPNSFVEALDGLKLRSITPIPQSLDPSQSLRCFSRTPDDGEINWNRSAKNIARLVRASAEPFAGAFTYLNGERLKIWRAHADRLPYPILGVNGQIVHIDASKGQAWVLAEDGVLVVEEVEFAGMRKKASVVIRSTRTRLGGTLESRLDALVRGLKLNGMLILPTQGHKNDNQ
jgi:UDP-4-amino-4-deoxy-L-arabinose formyltransferase/UDP-glucuronic acid dehydrogenase (UDP-4-keto-hexauronic acid decarboxylating)